MNQAAKYGDCARLALSDRDAERSIGLVDNLEKVDNINKLMALAARER